MASKGWREGPPGQRTENASRPPPQGPPQPRDFPGDTHGGLQGISR